MTPDPQKPLVSIITPSYNQAAYLEAAIQSVLAQDYQPIEYLIVDGASSDGSVEIIRRYQDRLAWWVSEPDHGQAEAINKGFARAQGKYIAWLNSDDLYLPGAVRSAVAVLEEDPALGMVFGDAITIDADGEFINRLSFGDWGLNDLLGFRIICQPAVFMRRTVLERAGYLSPNYHFMLDHHLWLRVAQQAPIKHFPGEQGLWAAARMHAAAKNVKQAEGFSRETLHLLEWMKSDPELAPLVAAKRRRIEAGAYRLNARYLLDGDLPGPALGAYMRSLARNPGFALRHWHRMVYAVLCMLGGKNLANTYYHLQQQRTPTLTVSASLASWPGICFKRPVVIHEAQTPGNAHD